MRKYYTVTKDVDILAPSWLSERIERGIATILYRTRDGHAEVKGVRVRGDDVAQIGDTIMYDGRRISVKQQMTHAGKSWVLFLCPKAQNYGETH